MVRVILKNWFFFGVIIIFIISFGVFVYLGINRIYEKEVALRHVVAETQLISAASTMDFFFSDIRSQLTFLKREPKIQKFVDARFDSDLQKQQIKIYLNHMVSHSGNLLQAYIMNSKGKEVVHADREISGIEDTYGHLQKELLTNSELLPGPQISFISGTDNDRIDPLMLAVISLFDFQKKHQGFLVLNIDMSLLFKMIPENISVQSSDKNRIFVHTTPIEEKTLSWNNTNRERRIISNKISGTETLHYTFVQLTDTQSLSILKHHRHALIADLFKNLLFHALTAIIVFLGFVGLLSMSTILRIKEKIKVNKTMVHALIALTDWRDPETGNHLTRTKKYSAVMAKKLRQNGYKKMISKQFIADIFDAAPLHDIGKVGIKDSILLKPGKFTPEEFEMMKQHVTIGRLIIVDLIKRLDGEDTVLQMALNICEYHHEKYDGSGYPKGMKGERIPVEARIFAIADVYDALRSARPYKKELEHDQVVEIIKSERGKHFDPDIVDTFLKCLGEFKDISNENRPLPLHPAPEEARKLVSSF